MCALLLDKQGCGNCAKDKSSQDSKNYSSNGSRPNTTLAGGSRQTVATEATKDLLSMIRAFAKEQKVPIMDDTQMQWWQDATTAAKEAHVRSSVHRLHNSCRQIS